MTLYCDPSARYFGWIVMDDVDDTIRYYGIEDFLGETKGTLAHKSRVITENMTKFLQNPSFTWIKNLVVEVPVGSQSVNVAWYLSAIQSILIVFARLRGINYVPCEQGAIKKVVHGRHNKVSKKETIQFVLDNYPNYSYIWQNLTKPEREALADTIAVFHYHKQRN